MANFEEYYKELLKREGCDQRELVSAWDKNLINEILQDFEQSIAKSEFIESICEIRPNSSNQSIGNQMEVYAIKQLNEYLQIYQIENRSGAGYLDRILTKGDFRHIAMEMKATSGWNSVNSNRCVLTSFSKKLQSKFTAPVYHLICTIIYQNLDLQYKIEKVRLDFIEPQTSVNIRLEASVSHKPLEKKDHERHTSQMNLFESIVMLDSKIEVTNFSKSLVQFAKFGTETFVEHKSIGNEVLPIYTNEFWTAKQRQSDSIHEVSYRACFKAQLPRFFIESLTKKNDIVYDPFAGRGTTIIEAALLGRHVVANDVNPLSKILCKPRLNIPALNDIWNRLNEIPIKENSKADLDLSMFFHPQTEAEIVSLKKYLQSKSFDGNTDYIDDWIRMVATNRLTGHSSGFFSVYTLPPNQAVKPERQKKINEKRNQTPEYRNTKELILNKSKSLMRDLSQTDKENLKNISKGAIFSSSDARFTEKIPSDLVQLTVTSPPFLDVVHYADDNWLRCWFNSIDIEKVKISMAKTIEKWCEIMSDVFNELYRITMKNGFVAFEVGEIKNGTIKLDEYVVSLGEKAGFNCEGIIINEQIFTKTSNIWGVKNNDKGTNSNRIVLFRKK